jgi:hypothetical protein
LDIALERADDSRPSISSCSPRLSIFLASTHTLSFSLGILVISLGAYTLNVFVIVGSIGTQAPGDPGDAQISLINLASAILWDEERKRRKMFADVSSYYKLPQAAKRWKRQNVRKAFFCLHGEEPFKTDLNLTQVSWGCSSF